MLYTFARSIFATWLALCLTAAHADPVRILCIGDSITQGGRADREEFTYRLPLQGILRGLGVPFEFVGSQRAGLQPGATWPAWFDPRHEGYYGARTAAVRDKLRQHLPTLPAPDIALIHLGTNDQGHGSFIEPLEDIVGMLRAKNPRVTILVGQIGLNGWRHQWTHFQVDYMASRLDTWNSRVIVVNHQEGWQANPAGPMADTFDWTHPNQRGQLTMAMRWFDRMRPFLPLGDAAH